MSYHKIDRLPGEVFKEIDGYDGYYEISNMGRVLSHHGKGGILRAKNKAAIVSLSLHGKVKVTTIGRLVWDYFGNRKRVPHYLDVTHINGKLTDNRIENLDLIWCHDKPVKSIRLRIPSKKYIGITKVKGKEQFLSSVRVDEKHINLGVHKTAKEASDIYQNALLEIKKTNKATKFVNNTKSIQGERWMKIDGYSGAYEISNMGRVRSLYRSTRIMKSSGEYPSVVLYKDGGQRKRGVANLVWDYFGDKKRDRYKTDVFHINGINNDNRISNLKLSTHREIMSNAYSKKKTSSKHTGVYYHKRDKRFWSMIFVSGKYKYIGSYKTEMEASIAYQKRLAEIQEQ